jgi:hypothetical protein
VAPVNDLENPMLLRIPAGSLKDLVAYAEMLSRRKAPYQSLVTKIGFDHSVAYQKFAFKALRWLTDDEADTVIDVMGRDLVGRITGTDVSPLAIEGTPPRSAHVEEEFLAPKPAPAPAPKPKPAPVAVAHEEEEPAPKPKPKSNVSALLQEADASLDDVLGMLDD